jgi:hypothetical protein
LGRDTGTERAYSKKLTARGEEDDEEERLVGRSVLFAM